MAKELSDLEFANLVFRTLGPIRSVRAVGWCVFWWMNGVRSFRDVDVWVGEYRRKGGPSRAVAYKVLADLRKVREAWATAEGRTLDDLGSLEQTAKRVATVTKRVAA